MRVDLSTMGKRVVVTAGAQVPICDVNADAPATAKANMPGITASLTDVSDEAQVDATPSPCRGKVGMGVVRTSYLLNSDSSGFSVGRFGRKRKTFQHSDTEKTNNDR